ncbi:helix-turn-helix transcriptional regulator [Crocosphaera sp. XPORK-15E]|uniref:helix-turn-helix domain-containing protein n=1 Tax=Crocosphaera sp. XPORK-15E TaxID=3110247 RepID=UPI002B1F87C0|nr:helix-turn-helix transcriptional regulator [Crocosphaera sp. XPORK-15E]MEA5535562.1 helix-turn-helix transcriptional regulator [Crocosphaera sp. XPORK-15E]
MKYEIIQKEGHSHVVIPVEMYEQLLEDSEMLADIQVYDKAKNREEESFPLDLVERISICGENPLKVWREYRHLTQEQLAEAIGSISKDYISELESGKKAGSIKVLKAIAAVLDVDVDMITT